jgi:hypothetical protein
MAQRAQLLCVHVVDEFWLQSRSDEAPAAVAVNWLTGRRWRGALEHRDFGGLGTRGERPD